MCLMLSNWHWILCNKMQHKRANTNGTAVPEGRQAEWNGALSRSEIKKVGFYPHEKRRPLGRLFLCG